MNIPTMRTLRLRLRAFAQEDAGPLHRIMGERGVLCYFPNQDPPSLQRIQKLIAGQLAHWEKHGHGWWAVELGAEAGLIGWAGLQYLSDTDETEVAYFLEKKCWGQGLATEAAKAGLEFGFGELGLACIVGIVHPDNIASQRVLEKAGMQYVERTQYFGMDCCRYVITEENEE